MYRDDGDQQTGEGGFDGRRWSYKLVEIVEKTEEYRSPSILILSYSLPIVSMCSLCDLVTRNLRVTLCIYIYTYICKVSFYSILFFFFRLYFILSLSLITY